MKKSHPKADPQTWANKDRLVEVLREKGEDASVAELKRMQRGELPPIREADLVRAAAYRRWNNLPPLPEAGTESNASREHAPPAPAGVK